MYAATELAATIGATLLGDPTGHPGFANARSIASAEADSLIWIKAGKHARQATVDGTAARTIIVPAAAGLQPNSGQVLLAVERPRFAFIRALQQYFSPPTPAGVHPTAFVHPQAVVDPTASVGARAYVGRAVIGPRTVVHPNATILDDVRIGADVIIHSGAVLGADGFGFERDGAGRVHKFPQIGGVLLEDEVEIGANSCVDRGALDDTILRRGVKLDNMVHIGHNVEVGAGAFVIANATVSGSVRIGERAWIAPSATIINGARIGDDALVGISALVTRNVPAGETWTGVPALPLREFQRRQVALGRLAKESREPSDRP